MLSYFLYSLDWLTTIRRENASDWFADELTILGAWDYAVADPDGQLGGGTQSKFNWKRQVWYTHWVGCWTTFLPETILPSHMGVSCNFSHQPIPGYPSKHSNLSQVPLIHRKLGYWAKASGSWAVVPLFFHGLYRFFFFFFPHIWDFGNKICSQRCWSTWSTLINPDQMIKKIKQKKQINQSDKPEYDDPPPDKPIWNQSDFWRSTWGFQVSTSAASVPSVPSHRNRRSQRCSWMVSYTTLRRGSDRFGDTKWCEE